MRRLVVNFSLDQLAQETFKINENLGSQFTVDNYEEFEELRKTSAEEIEKEIFPTTEPITGPGIWFWISKCPGTFCVKGKIVKGGEDHVKHEAGDEEVYFFNTPDLKTAQFIGKQFLNRRFPIEEDLLCNLSDPGFSWWFNENKNGFEIYFQSHGVFRARDYVRLGQIGDTSIAQKYLNEAFKLLNSIFQIEEFSSTHRQFSIKVQNPDCPKFRQFKNIFLKGEDSFENSLLENEMVDSNFSNFLQETALLRKFWLKIEEGLK